MKTENNNDAHCTLHTMHGILNELDYPRTRFCNINGKRIFNAKKNKTSWLKNPTKKKNVKMHQAHKVQLIIHTHRVYIRGQIFSVQKG